MRRRDLLAGALAFAATPAAATGPSTDQVTAMYEGREYEEIKLDGMRKIIASHN